MFGEEQAVPLLTPDLVGATQTVSGLVLQSHLL